MVCFSQKETDPTFMAIPNVIMRLGCIPAQATSNVATQDRRRTSSTVKHM